MFTCPFTTLAANCMIIDSTLYAQHHPLGVRSSMQIAPPCITKPWSILGEITLIKGGANGNSFGKITCSNMWGIFSSRISDASLLSGSILCNRTNHSKTLSLTSSTVKAESPRWALWILLNSFISRRRPMSLSQAALHSSCMSKAWFEILRLFQDIQNLTTELQIRKLFYQACSLKKNCA